ncbi:O-glucose prenyltransferase [Diaporthe sp. PMI_573]|nr:O-glucose prenyltransferase [Diaporthaceae sp. PMI_573]
MDFDCSNTRGTSAAPLKPDVSLKQSVLPSGLGSNSAADFWWRLCRPEMSGLLEQAGGYTESQRESHLTFVREQCAPWMGPVPTGHMADKAVAPVEMSVNYVSTREEGVVRFQMEPFTAVSGPHTVADDPSGKKAVASMLSSFERVLGDVDLTWAWQLLDKFMVTSPDEISRLREAEKTSLPPPLDLYQRTPHFNFAFDLSPDGKSMKTYFLPLAKSLATGESALDHCLDAVRSLEPHGEGLSAVADVLHEFLTVSCPGRMSCDYLGIDSTAPEKSRVKLYVSSQQHNSFDFVKNVFTLGGRVSDQTTLHGLEFLHSIWHLLVNVEAGQLPDHSDRPPKQLPFFLGCLYFSFEWRTGDRLPLVKIYIPQWQYAQSDRKIADNISVALRELGRNHAADEYLTRIKKTFPKADLDTDVSVHNQVSYAYNDTTGAYLTVYYSVNSKAVIKD